MTLWSATDAAAATGGTTQGDWDVDGFGIDSRTIRPGQMFVALKAARDGHDFVRAALDAGATAALVDVAWVTAAKIGRASCRERV